MTRISYMPTNRPSVNSARYAIQECSVLQGMTGQEHLFVLVEHDRSTHAGEHAEVLTQGATEYGVPTLHVTTDRWVEILDLILRELPGAEADRERFLRLLSPTGVAYSAGPNKAFLIAAAFGVDTVHRRDSDHIPDQRADGPAFPGVLEAKAIGTLLGEVSPVTNRAAARVDRSSEPVYFVGSGMFGDPPHDRRDLLSLDARFVAQIEQLSSPDASLDDLLAEVHTYFIDEPATRYEDDFYELDRTGRTELGVSCLWRVFLELPEMPIHDTLGCDYFQKNLLYQLSRPVLFHSRKMRHEYDPERARGFGLERFVDYSMRDLRYLILWRVWTAHNRYIRAHVGEYLRSDGSLNATLYARGLADAAESVLPDTSGIPGSFADIYATAAASASGSAAERLRAVSDSARALGSLAVEQVRTGIDDFVWLIERWGDLVSCAPAVHGTLEKYTVRN
jgi:hypothetical protein